MNKKEKAKKLAYLQKLGAHISRVRKRKAYSQDRLALEGSFSRGTMSKIEKGISSVEVYTLYRVSEILEVPLSELVDFE